jgi:ligand-binding sensor domain-containing protein
MRKGWGILVLTATLASAELLPIRSYSAADGLVEDRVNAIAVDARGFVWFATSVGISMFDGYRFTAWDDAHGFSSLRPAAFLADPSGGYWAGVAEGLRWFGGEGPTHFKTLLPNSRLHSISVLLRTRAGRMLAAGQYELFAAGDGAGMAKVPLPIAMPAGWCISALAEDHSGNLWVAAGLQVEVIAPGGARTTAQAIALPDGVTNISGMVEAPEDRMWVGTNLGLARIERRNGENGWHFLRMYGVTDGLAGPNTNALLRAGGGVVWVGTTAGISRFSERDAIPHFSNLGKRQGLTDPNVTAMAEDGKGNIWVGTESGRAMHIQPQGFTTFQEDDGLRQASLLQVLEDRRGTLITVSDSGGAPPRVFTFFDGHVFHQSVPRALGYRGGWVWQRMLLESASGAWWAGTRHGLCRFPAGPAAELLNSRPEACYSDEEVFHIFEDSRGNIWASASGDYLLRWNRSTGRVVYLRPDGSESPARCKFGGLAGAMAEDHAGNVWLGLWSGGLYRFGSGRMTLFRKGEGAPRGTVYALHVDAAGRLWIATHGHGLSVMANPAEAAPRYATYDAINGIGSNVVRSIVEDRFGRIWAGTPRGVVCLDPGSGSMRRYSTADGLPEAVIKNGVLDRSGALWFATSQGLARIVPRPPARAGSPPALLTAIRIAGEEYPVSLLGETYVRHAVLEPGRNRVEIEFAAPGSGSDEDLRYKFMLVGADSGWSAPQIGHRVDFRNLRAGAYRFLVKTVDPSGVASAGAAEFDFRILPPLWLRWWFLLPASLALLLAAYLLHSYRVAHLLAIERMRTDIATDLHDDIGASLARIAILSDVARLNLARGGEPAAAPLIRIGGMARELLDSLNDIVWSVRATDTHVDSLVRRMREFALDVLEPSGAGFALECDQALQSRLLSPDTRRHLLLIFKECVHNIAKHSGCTAARAGLSAAGGKLTLTVSDNGRAAPAGGNSRGGNGIPSMTRRARAMGGEIEFAGDPSGGHTVTLRIPLRGSGAARARRR